MSQNVAKTERDRQLLSQAQGQGLWSTLGVYIRLAGPGWLQSAITLGGGSLAGALFIGSLGGTSLLWLQLMAITMGVIMLSAISYVTLSTGERPFDAINRHINPALGWSWLLATSLANMIWCMAQFSLCYSALKNNLLAHAEDSSLLQFAISGMILLVVGSVVALNSRSGAAAKVFDLILKGLVGLIVLCFVGVVLLLALNGSVNWSDVAWGFVPDLRQWTNPTGEIAGLVNQSSPEAQAFWSHRIVGQQRSQMIAAAATAVGINMTFLMPYALLQRGWDRTFRGLARFDLLTGMAIPYILVTSCVVIASAYAFHGKADAAFLSSNVEEFSASPTFNGTKDLLLPRVLPDVPGAIFKNLDEPQVAAAIAAMAALPEHEKRIAASMVKRNADSLSQTLAPLIGQSAASWVFGLGVFGMGFSTIIILMLINGYVFQEALGRPQSSKAYAAGCLIVGLVGMLWPLAWSGDSQFWFTIVTSTFGMMLLPIAYITFLLMMNHPGLMRGDLPRGGTRIAWNLLMLFAVGGACVAAGTSIYDRITDTSTPRAILAGRVVIGMLVIFVAAVGAGFFLKKKS